MSEATTKAALKAAIDAQFTTPRVVDLAEAAAATKDHIILFVSRRYMDGRMADGSARTKGGRAVTRYVATTPDNVSALRERTAAAIEEKILAGADGPVAFETGTETEQDGNWFVASDSWTY